MIATLCALIPAIPCYAQTRTSYTVEVNDPTTRVFHITMHLHSRNGELRLSMPASTPGEINIKNHARYVLHFNAEDGNGRSLRNHRLDKQTWLVDVPKSQLVVVHYDVHVNYRDLLRLGTNWLDSNGGFIEGSSVFLYQPEELNSPLSLQFKLPPTWRIVTAMRADERGTYIANNYRQLLDSPIQFGILQERMVSAGNVHCRLVFDAQLPPYDQVAFDENIRKILANETKLMGSAPFEEYTVLFHWRPDLDFGGGLEHGRAMVMNIGKKWMLDLPTNVSGTFAHELFHAWNAKAIHPRDLDRWDYRRENYTTLMWFVEGVTNYYATLVLRRTGVRPRESFYRELSRTISSYESEPGRGLVSLADSGIAEWISPLDSLDYYSGGEVIGFLLDLQIRIATHNVRSLDDVMRGLYLQSKHTPYYGYTENTLIRTVNKVAGRDLAAIFDLYVSGKGAIDYHSLLSRAGLALQESAKENGARNYSISVRTGITDEQKKVLDSLLAGSEE